MANEKNKLFSQRLEDLTAELVASPSTAIVAPEFPKTVDLKKWIGNAGWAFIWQSFIVLFFAFGSAAMQIR